MSAILGMARVLEEHGCPSYGRAGLVAETDHMINNPILDLPLTEVMRKDIALPLQHVLNIFTVGNLLTAWRNPQTQRTIEEFFESSVQAQHAVATCAAWLGFPTGPAPSSVPAWWVGDAPPGEVACV